MSESESRVGEDTDLFSLPILRGFEDKRSYPRIDLRVPARVSTADKLVVRAMIRNLSREGLQIRSDRATAALLHPRGTAIQAGQGPSVIVRTRFPGMDEKETAFMVAGRLSYVAMCKKDTIAFGVEFVQITDDNRAKLDRFIARALTPA